MTPNTEEMLAIFESGKDPNGLFRFSVWLIGLAGCVLFFYGVHDAPLALLLSSLTLPFILSWLFVGPSFRKAHEGLLLQTFPLKATLLPWAAIASVTVSGFAIDLGTPTGERRIYVLSHPRMAGAPALAAVIERLAAQARDAKTYR